MILPPAKPICFITDDLPYSNPAIINISASTDQHHHVQPTTRALKPPAEKSRLYREYFRTDAPELNLSFFKMFNNTTIFKHFQSGDHKMMSLSIRSIAVMAQNSTAFMADVEEMLLRITSIAQKSR